MRPVEFGEAVPARTRLTLFSGDKPDRLFTVITFCIDKVAGVALDLVITEAKKAGIGNYFYSSRLAFAHFFWLLVSTSCFRQ
jgi:hypothetical protein